MSAFADKIAQLASALRILPGVGENTATRYAFFILSQGREVSEKFAADISEVCGEVRLCDKCLNITDVEVCDICTDSERRQDVLCVVSLPYDVFAIERAGFYDGLYQVLHGVLSPQNGVGPYDLKLDKLRERLDAGGFREVILATPMTMEGDATATYLGTTLAKHDVKLSRIARGIQSGGSFDVADDSSIEHAFKVRDDM